MTTVSASFKFRLLLLLLMIGFNFSVSSAQTANDIVNRHIEAIGGAEKMAALKSVELDYVITYTDCEFPDYTAEMKKITIEENGWTEKQFQDFLRKEAKCPRKEMMKIKYQVVDKMRVRIEAKDKNSKVVTAYNSTNTSDSSWKSSADGVSLLPRTAPSNINLLGRVSEIYYRAAVKKDRPRLLKNKVISMRQHIPKDSQIELVDVEIPAFEVAYDDSASYSTVVYSIAKDSYYLVRLAVYSGTGVTETNEDNARLVCNFYNHQKDEGIVIPYYSYFYDPLKSYSVNPASLYHQSLHELESAHINSDLDESIFKAPQK